MGKRYDVEQIQGAQFMDEEDRSYFQKFGDFIDIQSAIIAEQNGIEPDTEPVRFDWLMDTLPYNSKEYLVKGAVLTCSRRT